MKKRLIRCHQIVKIVLFLLLMAPFLLKAQPIKEGLTTIVLVRHAEKVDNSSDPDLNEEGYQRAEKLAEMFSMVQFDAVYSTDYKRTRETARPIAKENGLTVQEYEYQNPTELVGRWIQFHKGETILISGHSNSTPTLANAILGEELFEGSFEESDYGNVLVITISNDGERKLLHLRY